jgi:hypothetical protein
LCIGDVVVEKQFLQQFAALFVVLCRIGDIGLQHDFVAHGGLRQMKRIL